MRRSIWYAALPSQKKFHRSTARFKGFSGPIGSGKSQALCQEAIKLSYVNPGRVGLIGAPTYPMLRDATQAALFELLESNRIAFEFNKSENHLVIRETRSKILFRAVEDFERLRGSNLAWFGIDELTYTVRDAWLRLQGRLRDPKASRLCGFAVWTPKGYDWVYEHFIASSPASYTTVIAEPFENRHLLEKVPDFYDRLKDSYDQRFFQQEVMGEYLNLNAGRVYHAFERDRNISKATVDKARPLLWALDFNVDPMCSIVAQIHDGVVRVLDEIVLSRATTYQACEEFERRYGDHPGGLVIYADATGNRMQSTGHSDIAILREFLRRGAYASGSVKIPTANPAVRERVNLTNAKLFSAAGGIGLYVDSKCKELIKDLEQVTYKADSLVVDKDRDPRRTHLSDALGYLVWQECRPRAVAGEQRNKLL